MANVTRLDLLKRMFSDPKNYPYGFSRSGDFSISESKALSQYGCLIAALVDGKLSAETEEDQSMLAAAYGQADPQSTAERAWVKYQKRINRPKMGNIYGSRPIRETAGSRDELDDVEDSDIVIDDA